MPPCQDVASALTAASGAVVPRRFNAPNRTERLQTHVVEPRLSARKCRDCGYDTTRTNYLRGIVTFDSLSNVPKASQRASGRASLALAAKRSLDLAHSVIAQSGQCAVARSIASRAILVLALWSGLIASCFVRTSCSNSV